MAHDPQAEFNTPVSFRDADGANPVDIIVGNGVPDGSADPQKSALIGTWYCNYAASDDTAPWYVKIDEDEADDDWVLLPLANVTTAFDINGHWTWLTDKSIYLRGTGQRIYSPAADTAALALGATGDTWRFGDMSGSNYLTFNFRGELSTVGTARVETQGAFQLFDDFTQMSATEADTHWVWNEGVDGDADDPVLDTQEGGVLLLTTGSNDGTVGEDGSGIVCRIPVQADSGGLVFECRLHINTAITNVAVNLGFTDTMALEEPFTIAGGDAITINADDAACFTFDTSADTDEWFANAVDSTVADTGNATTGTAPTADTYQKFRIEVDSDGNTIRYYIDDVLEATRTGGGITENTNLYAVVIACGDGVASKTVDADYILIQHTR